MNIHTLAGHTNTVSSVLCQATDPQIITASNDSTVRLWDLAAGKSVATLTNHKKSVRGLVAHPKLLMFASGGPDNIKQWRCPDGKFIQVKRFLIVILVLNPSFPSEPLWTQCNCELPRRQC